MLCKKKMKLTLFIAAILIAILPGCATKTVNIDPEKDKGDAVMVLDYRDFEKAATIAVESMLQSGALSNPIGGKRVLAISRIINDTMERIDTDQLIKKIRTSLLKSGKILVTTAIGTDGPEDNMSMQARKLRKNEEFNQNTVMEKGRMIAPDLSLSGKIIQKNITVTKKIQQAEYYFQLTLTDIATGLAIWENETFIGKRGSNKSVSW